MAEKGKRMQRELTWRIIVLAWLGGLVAGLFVSLVLFHQPWLSSVIRTLFVSISVTTILVVFRNSKKQR